MAARSTSRFKQKPAVPFGDFMLPILGVIALGIVVVGIRILWAPSTPKRPATPQPVLSQPKETKAQPAAAEKVPETQTGAETAQPQKEAVQSVVIAQPIQKNTKAQPVAKTQPKETATAQPKSQPVAKAEPKPQTVAKQPAAKAEPKKETQRQPTTKSAAVKAGSIDTSKYIIQCGSYTDNAAANSVVASLKKIGYTAVVRKADVRGKTYYRVIVAGGADRSVADTIAQKIKNAGHPVLVRENK